MIITLSGSIAEKLDDVIVVDVSGVGYGLLVPLETYSQVSVGDKSKFYVYEHLRENIYDLYGFADVSTKALFQKLIEVNGVGPKMALNILSIGSVNEVRQAIATGDTRLIQSAPGVGKKVAERVVVDLKDKVGLISSVDERSLLTGSDTAMQDEAVQALVALGYAVSDAMSALRDVDEKLSTKERVTLALKAH